METTFLNAWEERLAFKGEWVGVENAIHPSGEGSTTGLVTGLDGSGALVLRTASGEEFHAAVGDLTLHPIS